MSNNKEECLYLTDVVFKEYVSRIALNTNDKNNLLSIINYLNQIIDQLNSNQSTNPKFKKLIINGQLIQVEGSLNNESLGKVLYYDYCLGKGSQSILNNLLLNKNLSNIEKNKIKENFLSSVKLTDIILVEQFSNRLFFDEKKDTPIQYLNIIKILLKNHNNLKNINNDFMLLIKKMLLLSNEIFNDNSRRNENNMLTFLHNFSSVIKTNDYFKKNKLSEDIIEILKEIYVKESTAYKIKDLKMIREIINSIIFLNGNLNKKITIDNLQYYFPTYEKDMTEDFKILFSKKLENNLKKSKDKEIKSSSKDIVFVLQSVFNEKKMSPQDLYVINNFEFFRNINVNNLIKNNEYYKNVNKDLICLLHRYENIKSNKNDLEQYKNFKDFYNIYMNETVEEKSKGYDLMLLSLENNFINLILTNITLVKQIYDNDKTIYSDLIIKKKNLFNYDKSNYQSTIGNEQELHQQYMSLNFLREKQFDYDLSEFEKMDLTFKKIFIKDFINLKEEKSYFYNDCYKKNFMNLNKDFLIILKEKNQNLEKKPYDIKNNFENFEKSLIFSLNNLINIKEIESNNELSKQTIKNINEQLLKNNDISLC